MTQIIRAYRPYFHASQQLRNKQKFILHRKWIKDTLIKHPRCALPAGTALLKGDMRLYLCMQQNPL